MFTTPNLNTWLNYIEQLHPKAIDLGLDRIQTVGERLGLLNPSCPVITVAGTNGKGSCVTILTSILSQQGYRVGAYFSPHLEYYNERIHIAGEIATDKELCTAFTAIETARQDISLTYFEWGTLAALWLFNRANLDVLVLEVGLGGRLDAVNIIDPDISVITTIDKDHMEWLGPDRESIGQEKAGIFRSQRPVVCGDLNPPHSIIETATNLAAPLYCQGTHFGYLAKAECWQFWHGNIVTDLLPTPRLLLQNAATALMTLTLLKNIIPVSVESIKQGLIHAFLPGRFQIWRKNPLVILDVAHNPEGCLNLYDQLNTIPTNGKTYAVVGMLKDKNHYESLAPLLNCIDKWYVASLGGERGMPSTAIANLLVNMNVAIINQFDTIEEAYQSALNHANIEDRIVVFGSFYSVSPIFRLMKE